MIFTSIIQNPKSKIQNLLNHEGFRRYFAKGTMSHKYLEFVELIKYLE